MMQELLRLYFDRKKSDQSIAIYLKNQQLEYVTLLDDVDIFMKGDCICRLLQVL